MLKRAAHPLLKSLLSELAPGSAQTSSGLVGNLQTGESRALLAASYISSGRGVKYFSKVAVTDPVGNVVTAEGDIPGAAFGKKSTGLDEGWNAENPAATRAGADSPETSGGTVADNLKFFTDGAKAVLGEAKKKVAEATGLKKPESDKERTMEPEGIMQGAGGRISGQDDDGKYDELKRTAKDKWDDVPGRCEDEGRIEATFPDAAEYGKMMKNQPGGPAGLNRKGHKDDKEAPWSQ